MLTFFTIFLITTLGFLIVSFWKDDFYFWERFFLGFGLGIALSTFWLFFLGVVEIPFSRELTVLPLAGIIGLLLIQLALKRKIEFPSRPKFKNLKKLKIPQIIFLTIIVFLVCWSFLQTLVWPPYEWDALALYDFRAQRFFETRSLAEHILITPPWLTTYTYSYPFFTSLAHALIYILGGGNPKFLYTLIYLSLLICFYYCLRRRTSKTLALGITAVLATIPSFVYHSTIAYTNLPYTFYFVMGTVYFWEWVTYKRKSYFWISALFLGFSTWVRSQDPFWIANLLILALFCLRVKKLKGFLVYLITFFSIRYVWIIYRASVFRQVEGLYHIPYRVKFDLASLFSTISFVIKNVLLDWRIFVLLFLAIFLWGGRKQIKRNWYISGLILLYLLMVFAGTYYLSINLWWWQKIGGSAARMSMFFFPLILYAVTAVFFTLQRGKKRIRESLRLRFKAKWKFSFDI